MKVIFSIVAIVAACGAAFFSFNFSSKFKELETVRLATIESNKKATADIAVADKNIAEETEQLNASKQKQEELTQQVSSLKSAESALKSESVKMDSELKTQQAEFSELEKALETVNTVLAGLGGGVTLETLPEKIQQIEDDKTAKQKRMEELETLSAGAEKTLASSRAELDRLAKRMVERSSRISRNSMEAVVTAVNQDWGFLVIGAGSNSGFAPQGNLIVERDGRTLARVRPSSIEPTQTIAEIDLKSLSAGVRLQPGDRVILAQPASN